MVERLKTTNEYFDLIIIGGGYVGAWCAFLGANMFSEWKIAVIDKSKMGSGASYFGADLDFPNNLTDEIKKMSALSRVHFNNITSEILDFPSVRLEAYAIGKPDSFNKNRFEKKLRQSNSSCNQLNISKKKVQLQKEQEIHGPIECYRAIDKSSISKLLLASQYQGRNVEIIEHSEVINVKYDRECLLNNILLADGREFSSRFVITSIGPWSLQIPWIKKFKVDWKIKKIICFYIDIFPNRKDSVLYFLDEDSFLMPMLEQKKWLFSVSSEEWNCSPKEPLKITEDELDRAIAILNKYVPNMIPYLSKGRVFCDTYSSKRQPITVAEFRNPTHLIAGGCGGSGYRLAPALAEKTINTLAKCV
ncbi:FAD-dependent oxidoreductase [Flavivirga jejuensis]|uniref:FAD-dependent oxidoreductase n=1 Tax=Flavivirga jejuensis TaxID=870487 RepID=A0ABT8WTQ1_9FLAO|nr:FAD-dependent oxidoreductase [Flavivirga jejuensis]MDO5976360.1 FAD-dependent oxidoreductase [Flavivirga jejuensis]